MADARNSQRSGTAQSLCEVAKTMSRDIFKKADPHQQERMLAAQDRARVFHAFNTVMEGTREGSHVTGLYYQADEKKLIVYVDTSSWTQELTMLREIIRARMETQGVSISALSFLTTRHPTQPTRTHTKPASQPAPVSVPLTSQEEKVVRSMGQQIGNSQLREALQKAIKANFEWKKGTESKNKP